MNMKTDFSLKADPASPLGINTQIKEQLKWLIGTGQIRPGEMLPPASQLADTLRVNRNTVNLVYTQLRDEGLVTMQKGRGTQVVEGLKLEQLRKQKALMYALIQKSIQEAQEAGIQLEEWITASHAYVQLFVSEQEQKQTICLVECREHDHLFYHSEVERITGAKVKTVFLEDVKMDGDPSEALNQADVIVTTLNHADELKKRFQSDAKPVVTIGATADFSTLMEIAKLDAGSKVGFVCLGAKGGQWMAGRVEDAGIHHIHSIPQGTDESGELTKLMSEAEWIYASSAVYEHIRKLAPDKVRLYPMKLEQSSETLLRQAAGEQSL